MDLTLGDGAPIYFITYEIDTKIIQPSCGVVTEGDNLNDNSSGPHKEDGVTPIFRKVQSASKQKILDYINAQQLQDPDGWLYKLDA